MFNGENKIDLLLVEASLDWNKYSKIKIEARLEKNSPYKECLKVSTGYLLAAIKNKGYKVKFVDMAVEEMGVDDLLEYIRKTNPSVIGMPSFTYQIPSVGELFSKIKNIFPNIILCAGGCHVSALPKRTLDEYADIDFVIKGEAETTMPMVLECVRNNKSISDISGVVVRNQDNYRDGSFEDVGNISFPAWEEINIHKYGGLYPHRSKLELPILTGRGCPFKCIFCCRQSGSKCRRREVGSVIEEIERNIKDFGCESISFLDETFILDKKWINEFIDRMKTSGLNKKIRWACSTRVSSVSLELIKDMKKAGCYYIFYGFESANENILKIIKKGVTPEQMKDAVRWTRQSGVISTGSFIIGLPGDTRSTILENIEFGKNLGLYSITFPIAVPFPGTKLRTMALAGEYGMRIISDDWSEYLANDFDIQGKGEIGHLESIDLSWSERRELQKIAYLRNPKKELSKYLKSIS